MSDWVLRRTAARVVLLDSDGHVLLLEARDPADAAKGHWWEIPGGGMDGAESSAEAARRELFEETGLAVDDPGLQVARREFVMIMPDGEEVISDERFFLVRISETALSREGWTELEREVMTEHRWWAPDELRRPDRQIWPQDIADLLAAALGEPPMTDAMPAPRLGCGAAILRDGRLLLVKRRREPEGGFWGLPGGKVDWLEPVAAAVAREIAEELALEIRPERLLCVVDHIDAEARQHWVAPVYLVEDAVGDPVVQEPEALAACGWFALDDLPSPLTRATVQALAHLR